MLILLVDEPDGCSLLDQSLSSTGVDAVLGHLIGGCGPVPDEQLLRRIKHSPGSGVLSVSVISDGPTRILRVTDVNNKVGIL